MTDLTDEALRRYFAEIPFTAQALHADALYHQRITWLSSYLSATDRAMREQDVPEATRAEIIWTVLAGDIEAVAGLDRCDQARRAADQLARQPPGPVHLPGTGQPTEPLGRRARP